MTPLLLIVALSASPYTSEHGSTEGEPAGATLVNFDTVRGHLGGAVGFGVMAPIAFGNSRGIWGAQAWLHGGIWYEHFNAALEIAPGSDFAFASPDVRASFFGRVTLGLVATLSTESTFAIGWPFRIWGGAGYPGHGTPHYVAATNQRIEVPTWSIQFSLFGVAVRTPGAHVEVNLLSPYFEAGSDAFLGVTFIRLNVDALL